LPSDAEEVDLSSFELIEDFDAATWAKLESNKTMKRLKLPPSLLTIRMSAFEYYSQLAYVTFPSSLRSIEDFSFRNCTRLAMNDFKVPDSLEYLGDDAFSECRGLTGKLSTHITGYGSFNWCTGLTSLDLDESITEIKDGCFAYCTGLIGPLNLPSSLQIIGQYAFADCRGLTGNLIIPPFVSYIHPDAFDGCSGMTGIDQAIAEHFVGFES
jgi:hypothetical protein